MSPAKPARRAADVATWRDLFTPGPLIGVAKTVAVIVTVALSMTGVFTRLDNVETAVKDTKRSIAHNHDSAAVKFRSIQQRLDCVAAHRQRDHNTCF